MADTSPSFASPSVRFTADEDAELLRAAIQYEADGDRWNIIADLPLFRARGRLPGYLMKRHRALVERERSVMQAAWMQAMHSQVSVDAPALDESQAALRPLADDDDMDMVYRAPSHDFSSASSSSDSSNDESVALVARRTVVSAVAPRDDDSQSDASLPRGARVLQRSRLMNATSTRPASAAKTPAKDAGSSSDGAPSPKPARRRLSASKRVAAGKRRAAASDASSTSSSDSDASSASSADAKRRPARRPAQRKPRRTGALGPAKAVAKAGSKRRPSSSSDSAPETQASQAAPMAMHQHLVDALSGRKLTSTVHADGDRLYHVTLEKAADHGGDEGRKFALLQLLVPVKPGVSKEAFAVFQKWGRVDSNNSGHSLATFDTLDQAIDRFHSAFREKTGSEYLAARFEAQAGRYVPTAAARALTSSQAEDIDEDTVVAGWEQTMIEFIRAGEARAAACGEDVRVLLLRMLDAGAARDAAERLRIVMSKVRVGQLQTSYFRMVHACLLKLSAALAHGASSASAHNALEDLHALLPRDGTGAADSSDFSQYADAASFVECMNRVVCRVRGVLSRTGVSSVIDALHGELAWLPRPVEPGSSLMDDLEHLLRGSMDSRVASVPSFSILGAFELVPGSVAGRMPAIALPLPNSKLLWRGSPALSALDELAHGLPPSACALPPAAFPFGRGFAFTSCSTGAALHALGVGRAGVISETDLQHWSRPHNAVEVVLFLYEVACGRQYAVVHRQPFATLPPRSHSIHVCGRRANAAAAYAPWPNRGDSARSVPLHVPVDEHTWPASPMAAWGPAVDVSTAMPEEVHQLNSPWWQKALLPDQWASSDSLYDVDIIMDIHQARPSAPPADHMEEVHEQASQASVW